MIVFLLLYFKSITDYFVIGPVQIEVPPAAGGIATASSSKSAPVPPGTSHGGPPYVVNVTVLLESGSNRQKTSSCKIIFLFHFDVFFIFV